MRDLFPGYYRPTPEEFDRLWGEGIIALDSNVLLNLYRYKTHAREKLFDLLLGLEEKLWLPHQAALEFQRNRPAVILEQETAFEKLAGKIKNLSEEVQQEIDEVIQEGRHPVLDPQELRGKVENALDSLRETIENWQAEHPNLLEEDPIRKRIDELFAGKVGEPFNDDKLETIRERGEERYEQQTPPGYKDDDKSEQRKYGDLILWFQIMKKASKEERPMILVTDEGKEDWWREAKGQTIGPRPEMIEEMREQAGVLFYLYRPQRFMSYAADYLEQEVTEETLAELRRVSDQYRQLHSDEVQLALEYLQQASQGASSDIMREFVEHLQQLQLSDLMIPTGRTRQFEEGEPDDRSEEAQEPKEEE